MSLKSSTQLLLGKPKHLLAGIVVLGAVVLGVWLWLRKRREQSTATGGHTSPADAESWGWAVYPRGITGWREIGPNGEIIDHDTGGEGLAGIGAPS